MINEQLGGSAVDHMNETRERKNHHIELCLNEKVDFYEEKRSLFDQLNFEHEALPEINREQCDLSCEIFGKKLAAPLIIGAMTGGAKNSLRINQRLGALAENFQVGDIKNGIARSARRPDSRIDSNAIQLADSHDCAHLDTRPAKRV